MKLFFLVIAINFIGITPINGQYNQINVLEVPKEKIVDELLQNRAYQQHINDISSCYWESLSCVKDDRFTKEEIIDLKILTYEHYTKLGNSSILPLLSTTNDSDCFSIISKKYRSNVEQYLKTGKVDYYLLQLAGYIGDTRYLPYIEKECSESLISKDRMTLTCEMVLAKYGDDKYLQKIYKKSFENNPLVKYDATIQLGYVGGEAELERLISMLDEKNANYYTFVEREGFGQSFELPSVACGAIYAIKKQYIENKKGTRIIANPPKVTETDIIEIKNWYEERKKSNK